MRNLFVFFCLQQPNLAFLKILFTKGPLLLTVGYHRPLRTKVAFTLRQILQRKMVVCLLKKTFLTHQMAKSMAYYAAKYALFEHAFEWLRSFHSRYIIAVLQISGTKDNIGHT